MNDAPSLRMAVARLKKPHRHFNPGDLVIGERRDGSATNLVCWGWSSKHRRIIGGRHGFRLRYCSWELLPERFRRAAESAKFGHDFQRRIYMPIGTGHLRIIKWIDGSIADIEHPPPPRNEAWLRRLLLELSCGNMPLSRMEAAPSMRRFSP